MHAGCPVGNIIAIPITGMLAKYGFDGGWPSVFYCFGMYLFLYIDFCAFSNAYSELQSSNAN